MFSVNLLRPAARGRGLQDPLDGGQLRRGLIDMDPERERLYETCQRLGMEITVIKAFGGGDLLDETLSPVGAALPPVQCIHYALTHPAVASVMSGARGLENLRGTLAYESASLAGGTISPPFHRSPGGGGICTAVTASLPQRHRRGHGDYVFESDAGLGLCTEDGAGELRCPGPSRWGVRGLRHRRSPVPLRRVGRERERDGTDSGGVGATGPVGPRSGCMSKAR